MAKHEIDPLEYSLRAHEILEDGIHLQLSGQASPWSGAALVALRAEVRGTGVVLDTLAPLIARRESTDALPQAASPQADATFPDDALVAEECHGDLTLQLCANGERTLLNALRDLMRATRGAFAGRWKIEGFLPQSRESGSARNLLGFKDGTANPSIADAAEMDRVVWVGRSAGEPAWAVSGTYQVVRIIRNRVEFWDRVARSEQELMIGRDKGTGAPLGRLKEGDDPTTAPTPRAIGSRWTPTSASRDRAPPRPRARGSCAEAAPRR